MNAFVDGYERGYCAGLRLATAIPGERNPAQATDAAFDERHEVVSRPAYQHGFVDGLRDGVEVLASVSSTAERLRWAAEITRRPGAWVRPAYGPDAVHSAVAEDGAGDSVKESGMPPFNALRDELHAYRSLLCRSSTYSDLRAPVERLQVLINQLETHWRGDQ